MDEHSARSAASVFEPRLFLQQVAGPKTLATQYLDEATRSTECKESLEWFVTFSSVASSLGKAGRRFYGFADAYMESICEARHKDGQPGMNDVMKPHDSLF